MRSEIAILHARGADILRRRAARREICERIHAEIRPLQDRLEAIQNHPASRKNVLHALFSHSPYTDEALREIQLLQRAIDAKLATIPEDIESALRQTDHQVSEIARAISDYEAALVPHLKREERQKELQQKKQLQKQRIAELRATAASVNGTTRKLGSRVRNRLAKQQECPYCGGPLGLTPHADHIYPVSKGGRSVERNMVLVCSTCNTMKAHLTLSAFIKTYGLDRNAVEARLGELGKDF